MAGYRGERRVSSVDTIGATLRTAVDHLHKAVTHVRAARDMAEENRDLSERLGAQGVVQRFKGIADKAEELQAMLVAGIDTGERLIAQTEAIRHGESAGDVSAPADGTAPTGPRPVPFPPQGMPILAGPDGLRRVLDALPERATDDGPTSGHLFRDNGRPIPDGGLRSSRDTSLLADLDLDRRGRRSESMASHVEAKAAAMMRRGHAPQHAVLVINNPDGPCGWLRGRQGRQRYGTSCDELLADALPADSTLTVRWRDSGGVERSQVYRGTGRSIRS
jgi:hypothetical protein